VYKREQPKFGNASAPPPCGRGFADPLKIHPSTCVILPNLVVLCSNGTSVIKEIRLKIWPLCPAFRGHSRSPKPTRIYPLPTTSY